MFSPSRSRHVCAARIGLVWTLFTVGCSSSGPTAADRQEPWREVTLEQVLDAYERLCDNHDSIRATGSLELRDVRAGLSGRLRVHIRARRGAGMLVEHADFRLHVGPETYRFGVGDREQTGDVARPLPNGDEIAYAAIVPLDLAHGLLPEPLVERAGHVLSLESEARLVGLAVAAARDDYLELRREIWFDRQTLLPQRATRFQAGELVSEISWRDYRDGVPREVLIVRPGDGTLARLRIDRRERLPAGSAVAAGT